MTIFGAQHWASAALILFAGSTSAFWRLECDGSVGLARLDPLMNPGGVSDHVHSIKGGSGMSILFRFGAVENPSCIVKRKSGEK